MGRFGKIIALPGVLVCGVLAGGCDMNKINDVIQEVSVAPVMTHSSEELNRLPDDQKISVLNLDTYKFPGEPGKTAKQLAAEDDVHRNRLQSELMARSDIKCAQFRKFIFAVHGTRKLALRSLTLGLSGAGALFTGGTSQALSAASTGFQGFDEAYDAEVLQQQSITLILQTIGATRTAMDAQIQEKRKLPINKYTGEDAIKDAGKYHALCSLTEALAELSRAVQENSNNKKILEEKDKTISEKDKTIADRDSTINRLRAGH